MTSQLNNFYSELKSRNEIVTTAYSFNYSGTRTGSCLQGDCPTHGSSGHKCLVIWPKIQAWKCYHCGKAGDVINLVELYKRCDHKTAVKYLADKAGMPYWGGNTLTPEELARREAELKEKVLVENMLTEATNWYHRQLVDYPEIATYLMEEHYGFSLDVIKELKIGFAPVSKKKKDISELADHLNSIPEFKGKIHLTGLFNFKSPAGPYWDYFKGRIVFPYWRGGKVLYMTARATSFTPQDKSEGNLNRHGVYEYFKYKKLRTYEPEDEKKKHISKHIQNDIFMGEDHILGAEEIIITEGAPDWVSAVDKGFAAISPVTTSFREQDIEKLGRLTLRAKSIYIINDNEKNEAGLKGALKTGKYLTERGRNVFIVMLPKPDGVDKIDLNEYLMDHTADDLRQVMKEAKSLPQVLIDQLPGDYLRAQSYIQEELAPLLMDMDKGKLQYYADLIAKKAKVKKTVIDAEIDYARERKNLKEAEEVKAQEVKEKEEAIKVDPEIEKAAVALTKDPQLFKKRLDAINEAGVVGERKSVAMYFCAMDSRLLPNNMVIPNVLAVKNAGHFGAGKSFTLTMCAQIYPEESYFMITNGSAKSLYFLNGGLKHKCLIVTEGFQFQEKNAADSELVYSVRSLISEGRVSYCVVEKGEDGKLVTVEKKLEGPTSFITTTIMNDLEPQLEDRLFTIHPDEGFEQTRDIITMTGLQRADLHKGLDKKVIDIWKQYHRLLSPVEVVMPFSPAISSFITKNSRVPLATRRAFNRVLIVVQSVACAYQHQRKRNENNKVIVEICDYWMALQIVSEAFRENLGGQDKVSEERLSIIEQRGQVTSKELAKLFGVSSSQISGWTKSKVKNNILSWCDEDGQTFSDEKTLRKAKHSGKAYIRVVEDYGPISITGLPTPYELTGDAEWKEGGKLLKQYDLELDKRVDLGHVFSGVQEVFIPDLNTMDNSEPVDTIKESDNSDTGVKVFIDNEGDKDKNIEESKGSSLMPKQEALELVRASVTKKELVPDKRADELSVEFANITGDGVKRIGKISMTPEICRTGCKHYDSVKDVNDGEFKEFCWERGTKGIIKGQYCACFESKEQKLTEGILSI